MVCRNDSLKKTIDIFQVSFMNSLKENEKKIIIKKVQ